MKITIKAVLWAKDEDSKGECPIALSISGNGKRTYYNTKIKCPAGSWNGAIENDVEHYDIKNATIDKMISDVNREILNRELQGQEITLDDVKAMFNPTKRETGDFLAFYRAYIDNIIATKKQAPGSIAVWETQHKELKTYCKGKLTFSQVTGEYLNKYHEFLCAKIPAYEPTTLHKKLKKIKQIVDLAVKLKKIPSDQVAAFDMISYEEPDTNYLTYDQIKAIEKLLYTGKLDAIPNLKLTTAFFLVECLAGIRFSDWGKFKVEKLIHNRNLKVRTTKNGQPVYLDLTVFKSLDRIVSYIADNGMEWSESEGTANAQLKVLGINLGLSFALCTHDGRRSYGTLLGELGYSTRFIAEAMGITEGTAKRYVKVTRQSLNAEMKRNGGI